MNFKTIKIISVILMLTLVFCAFITIPVSAKETTVKYGYSEIANINIGITDDVFSAYNRFNPVFNGNRALISADGWKYGYIDLTGKLVIPMDYTLMSGNFLGNYAAVDKSWSTGNNARSISRYGLIDRNGNIILPLKYVDIIPYNGNYFNEYGFAVAYIYGDNGNGNELYGAVDKNNNIVIPFEYEQIGEFIDGKAKAIKDDKHIIIDINGNESEDDTFIPYWNGYNPVWEWDKNAGRSKCGLSGPEGNLVLPCEYDDITYFKDFLFIAGNYGKKFDVIDVKTGKILATSSDRIALYSDYNEEFNLLVLNKGESYWESEAGRNGTSRFGAINLTTGETVIPFEYNMLYGIANDIIAANKNGKVGFIDQKNNIVLPFVHDGIFIYGGEFVNGKAIVYGEKYDFIIDDKNNILYKTDLYSLDFKTDFNKYGYIGFYKRDSNEHNINGIMDTAGKVIIPALYNEIRLIADKYILCGIYDGRGNQTYTIFDLKGNKITKDEYYGVLYLEQTDSFLVNGTADFGYYNYPYGIINNKANYILPAKYLLYDAFNYGPEGIDSVKDVITAKDTDINKYGYISSSGDILVPMIFDYACSMNGDGYAIVKQDKQWKIIRIRAGYKQNGDVIGNVLNSDVKTYINGQRIPCYNIKNKAVVLLADLKNYGFDVQYVNKTRTSTVTRNKDKEFAPIKDIENNTKKPGTVAFSYLFTDIVAVVNGKIAESYNVQGNLAIFFESLSDYGTFTWDNKTRTSKLTLY